MGLGYRITYENGAIRRESCKKRQMKWKKWVVGASAAALAVMLCIPKGRLWARDLVLPGDAEVTAAALEGMVCDLRDGEPMGEALEAFCREILAGGT